MNICKISHIKVLGHDDNGYRLEEITIFIPILSETDKNDIIRLARNTGKQKRQDSAFVASQPERGLYQFFPVLFRGVTYNVPLEKLKKRPKNANFLNIHQI